MNDLVRNDLVRLEEFSCPEHGEVEIKKFLVLGEWKGGNCPKCAATLELEQEQVRQLEEQKKLARDKEIRKKVIEANLGAAMIPLRFREHSFATFVADSVEKNRIKSVCEAYAHNFPQNLARGVSMTFCGTTGAGKTHLACSIANHVVKEHAATALFVGVIEAIRRVKECYAKTSKFTEREAIANFTKPDLLILDEVGVQFGTQTEHMILTEIINKRYEEMRPTIIISNLGTSELTSAIGDRIVDRMRENGGQWLVFNWESHRKNLKIN